MWVDNNWSTVMHIVLNKIFLAGMEKLVIEEMVDDFCTFYLAGQYSIVFQIIILRLLHCF